MGGAAVRRRSGGAVACLRGGCFFGGHVGIGNTLEVRKEDVADFLLVAFISHIVVINKFNQFLGVDIEIGRQHFVAVAHVLHAVTALDGNGNLLCLIIHDLRRLRHQSHQLRLGKVGGDIFQTAIGNADQIHRFEILQFRDDLGQHLALALGTAEVRVDFTDTRVVQRLRTVHIIGALAFGEAGEQTVFFMTAHIARFGGGDGDLDAAFAVELADLVDHGFECVEVNNDILVHRNAEIGLDGLFQQIHAAYRVGRIQLGAVFARNLDVKVTQEGNHLDLFVLAVNRDHHHSVASTRLFHGTAVAADEKHVFDIRVEHHRVGQFDLAVVHVFQSGSVFVRLGIDT